MRRKSATAALSPKLLKHFAAATVVLTAILAVFASGADWGAQAQVSAVEAKNQFAQTETEKFGTRRVATTLKIANAPAAVGFGDDAGDDFGGGGGYAPSGPRAVARPAATGGSAWAAPSGTSAAPRLPGAQAEPGKVRPTPSKPPTPDEIAQIAASSAQRSGAASSGD